MAITKVHAHFLRNAMSKRTKICKSRVYWYRELQHQITADRLVCEKSSTSLLISVNNGIHYHINNDPIVGYAHSMHILPVSAQNASSFVQLFRYHIGYRHIGVSVNFRPYRYWPILFTNMYRYRYNRKQKKRANYRVWKMCDNINFCVCKSKHPTFISVSYQAKCNPNLFLSTKANTLYLF